MVGYKRDEVNSDQLKLILFIGVLRWSGQEVVDRFQLVECSTEADYATEGGLAVHADGMDDVVVLEW